MALEITYTDTETGIPLQYHRVSAITQTTNDSALIEVCSYLQAKDRAIEKMNVRRAAINPNFEPEVVYSVVYYYQAPYQDGMTCSQAYTFLKTLPQFKKATDVFEEGENA